MCCLDQISAAIILSKNKIFDIYCITVWHKGTDLSAASSMVFNTCGQTVTCLYWTCWVLLQFLACISFNRFC